MGWAPLGTKQVAWSGPWESPQMTGLGWLPPTLDLLPQGLCATWLPLHWGAGLVGSFVGPPRSCCEVGGCQETGLGLSVG